MLKRQTQGVREQSIAVSRVGCIVLDDAGIMTPMTERTTPVAF
jgi:hypothetical protein